MKTVIINNKKVKLSFAVLPHVNPEKFKAMWDSAKTEFSGVALTNYIGSDTSGNAYFQVWGDSTPYILDASKF